MSPILKGKKPSPPPADPLLQGLTVEWLILADGAQVLGNKCRCGTLRLCERA